MAKALVLYHSQEFGNTALMAQAVTEGLKKGGCEVDLFNTNDGRFDIATFPQYDRVAFGSPDYYSYIAGGLKMFIDDAYIAVMRDGMKGMRNKPYALFYTHGGDGKVREVMPRIFRGIGTLVDEPLECHGKPDNRILEKCRALGSKLAKANP